MSGTFQLKQTADGKFMFNLKAGNGQVILTSQTYSRKEDAIKGIQSVQTNAEQDNNFERKVSESGQPFFVLHAANHQQVGRSELYSGDAAMETGIASVKTNAPAAKVKDETAAAG